MKSLWQPAFRQDHSYLFDFAAFQALAAGEPPGWVARTLGHVDTSYGLQDLTDAAF